MSQSGPPASTTNDGTRQKKRARASETPVLEELSKTTRSEKYWCQDGNIILHVEAMLFRVHGGLLSRHSTVFNDMCSLPPAERSETESNIEGCEVVGLPGDKAEDWERILSVIYDLDTTYKETDELPIDKLVSMLRLGRKYQFDGIFNGALERISKVLPVTLEGWNRFPKGVHSVGKIISILLEIGNQTLLPSLFYYCSTSTRGTVLIFEICRSIDFKDVDPTLGERLAIGREKISAACLQRQLNSLAVMPEPDLNNQHICLRPICRYLKENHLRRHGVHIIRTVFNTGPDILNYMDPEGKFCKKCRDDVSASQDAHRQAIWDKLPTFFGLPEWQELKNL